MCWFKTLLKNIFIAAIFYRHPANLAVDKVRKNMQCCTVGTLQMTAEYPINVVGFLFGLYYPILEPVSAISVF